MDTEKKWEEFEKNDTQFRKSESVQQDIQQILDTVTQIKTDVDQLKGENTEAAGPVDTEPALSAPEDNQPPMAPPEDMSGAAPGGEMPQEPMGDLMAQSEDGAATPTPEEPAAAQEVTPEMLGTLTADDEDFFSSEEEAETDEDKLLEAAMSLEDPNLKQQVIALVYQAIEEKKGGGAMAAPADVPMDMAAPEAAAPGPEEVMQALASGDIGSMMPPEDTDALMRSADSETVQCDANPAKLEGTDNVQESDDEDDEDKKDDDEKTEPGVNDGLPSKEEDKDSTEDLPEVTEVKVETKEEDIDESDEDVDDETMAAIDSILEEAKEKIKDQILDKDDSSPFLLSTSEMMKIRKSGGSHRSFKTGPIKKSIEWPESFEGVSLEDKCRLFAKSFSQMSEDMQDAVVTLMDDTLSAKTTEQIFKSEGVDLDAYYEPVMRSGQTPEQTYTAQCADDVEGSASEDNGGMVEPTEAKKASADTESIEACAKSEETEPVQECNDTVQESVAKSAGVGIHIPTVSEMMSFKKSGTSMYTAISREAAEPHGIVDMGNEPSIPSVKEMFAKRFGKA